MMRRYPVSHTHLSIKRMTGLSSVDPTPLPAQRVSRYPSQADTRHCRQGVSCPPAVSNEGGIPW